MPTAAELDAVTFEVLKNAFVSVCNEMALAVEMSAYSLIISEGRDFSATLYDADGQLVSQGENDLPSHAGTAPFTVAAVREHYGVDRMRPGDVYVMNDPYMGGTHLQDVRLVKPIFLGEEIIGYVATTGHWSDVGGMVPGSFYIEASEIYQEGLRIPPVLIYRDGDRERFTPWGLFGGKNAPPQRIYRHKSGGGTDSMGMFFSNRPLDKHDRIEYLSTGGGGYGPPEKRVLERIIEDVENEFTSLEFVRENYGVVVEAVDPEALDYRVDDAATRELRTEMFGNEWADVPLLADEIAAGEGSTGAGERRVGAQARLDR